MTWFDQFLADRAIVHGINLLRFSAGVQRKILAILDRMSVELSARILDDKLTMIARARMENLLADTNGIIERYYADISNQAGLKLSGLARTEPAMWRQAFAEAGHVLGVRLDVAMPSPAVLETLASEVLIQKAPSRDWWKQQGRYSVWRFSNEVRQGIAQGETNEQIVSRLAGNKRAGTPGALDISKSDARRLVQASVQTVANSARQLTFQQNRNVLDGIEQLSTLDGHTTPICLAYSGAQWDMDYQPINGTTLPYENPDGSPGCPRHWGCRSVIIPIAKSFADMGIDLPDFEMTTRASEGGQVAASTTMADWLKTRTKAQLDEQLGKGRADLYRRGVITLQQLLDQSGNPLSLKQLQDLYA